MSEWISVNNKMPDKNIPVLTRYIDAIANETDEHYSFAVFDGKWHSGDGEYVLNPNMYTGEWHCNFPTHWMPLPEPPRA